MHKYIDLAALGKVLLVSLIAGVGLVSVFGVGLVGVSEYRGQMQEGAHSGSGRGGGPAWLLLAGLSFAVVVVVVVLGVYSILE